MDELNQCFVRRVSSNTCRVKFCATLNVATFSGFSVEFCINEEKVVTFTPIIDDNWSIQSKHWQVIF